MDPNATPAVSPHLILHADGIAELVFDSPGETVNVLTETVLDATFVALERLHAEVQAGTVRGLLVRSGKSLGFVAGADLIALEAIRTPDEAREAVQRGQALFDHLSELPIPTVAAIHGAALGGGAELALACRERVVSDHPGTRLAFPEVLLGILPAWGGTTRLPRLIGLRPALDLLLSGRSISGGRARRMGLVDEVLPQGSFHSDALSYLRARVEGRRPDPRSPTRRKGDWRLRRLEETRAGHFLLLSMAGKRVRARTRGHYPAPLRILTVLEEGARASFPEALEAERRGAVALLTSPEHKNLLHVFQLREEARKGGRGVSMPSPSSVDRIGILGAGVMGGGIAQVAARAGLDVRLKDLNHPAVGRALAHAFELTQAEVRRGKISRTEADRIHAHISGGLDYAGFGVLDLVVEAVVEKREVKQSVLREVEGQIRSDGILATNTSTLRVRGLAEGLQRPEQFCGMHFFNPVHRMPLVEVIPTPITRPEVVATVYALALKLGKVPVVVQDGPGFLVNRILGPYLNEAAFLLGEGCSVEAVDEAALSFGMPMGPLRLVDEVGIDVASHAGRLLREAFGARMEPAPALAALAASGRLGRKGGLGVYQYAPGRPPQVDPGLYALLGLPTPSGRGRGVSRAEILERLTLAMLNEAAHLLEEGIASCAADVDLALVLGAGFPPFLGGLLRHADATGRVSLLEAMDRLHTRWGARFQPAPALLRVARSDAPSFYEAFPRRDGDLPPGAAS